MECCSYIHPEAAREINFSLPSFVAPNARGRAKNGRRANSFIVDVEEKDVNAISVATGANHLKALT